MQEVHRIPYILSASVDLFKGNVEGYQQLTESERLLLAKSRGQDIKLAQQCNWFPLRMLTWWALAHY